MPRNYFNDMPSFLKQRTRQNYFIKKSVRAKSTLREIKYALNAFDRFVSAKYEDQSKKAEQIIEELLLIKNQDAQKDYTIEILQEYINHLNEKNLQPYTIKAYVGHAKRYLQYHRIKIYDEDLRLLEYPRQNHEEKHPLTKDEIKKLLDNASEKRKALYLVMSSSGMRIEETVALRKRDFDLSGPRIKITIPAKFTKTKKSRITFVSKEAEPYLKSILDKIGIDDIVFGSNPSPYASKINEELHFTRTRKKAGLTERYDSGTHKITLQSFRSWFISKCNRVEADFGHLLAGHELYMKRYDRWSEEEKLKKYIECEPLLSIFGNTPTEQQQHHEIENLKQSHISLIAALLRYLDLTKNLDENERQVLKDMIKKS